MREWPGVHAVRAILDGEPLIGYWFHRSQEYAARRRGETFDRLRYAEEVTVELSQLPCWRHLSEETYKERVASLAKDIEERAAAERKRTGRPVLAARGRTLFGNNRGLIPKGLRARNDCKQYFCHGLLGVKAILAQHLFHRPAYLDRSPAPLFHVATHEMWKTLYDAYAWFVAAFRDASEKLRAGNRDARFPRGSFPPGLPFVAG